MDRLLELGKLGVDKFPDLPQAFLLSRVIASEIAQRVDIVLDLAGHRMVRLQIPFFAGQDEPSLAGLSILEHRQDMFETLDDLVGVRHPPVRFEQSLRTHVGTHADRRDDHQPHDKPRADLCSNTHRYCSGSAFFGPTK